MIASMRLPREGIGKRDIAIATVLSGLGVYLMVLNVTGWDDRGPDEHAAVHVGNLLPLGFAIPLFLLVTVPLLWRRVAPMSALYLTSGATLLNLALLGSEFLRCGVFLPTIWLLTFSVGARVEGREARHGLWIATGVTAVEIVLELGPVTTIVMTALTAAMWWVGRVVASRNRMTTELERRTAELREARDERARLEVATDRARLSRELDELLHRRLGELARLADDSTASSDGAAATATLVDIERESRLTLEEMRAVVGVLRDDEARPATSPQPTLTHLDALLVQAKGAGARLMVDGKPRVLPPGVELSAYRIVEHLLDALEDSPAVEVNVRFEDDALEIAVSGRARRRANAAIERARERVLLHRGSLETITHGGRAAAVAHLPLMLEA
jgi:hypothetical protein